MTRASYLLNLIVSDAASRYLHSDQCGMVGRVRPDVKLLKYDMLTETSRQLAQWQHRFDPRSQR
jgi:hypothetical protein